MSRLLPVIESLLALAVTLPLAVALHLPTLWFAVPFVLLAVAGRDFEKYGLTWAHLGSAQFHLRLVAVVFGGYLLGHYLFGRFVLGAEFVPRLPESPGWLVLDQVLGIGLPEEFFFCGYMQTQFNQSLGRTFRFAGVRFGWGLPMVAALFAVCHTVRGGPARLIVFFPGLLYGWLRERSDSIAVPAAYHAVSNVLMSFMLTSFGLA